MIDVGGGASPLADALLSRGFHDVTVLDISATGPQNARWRLGPQAQRVRWLIADILTWQPKRQYRVWHDRAVFHFLITSHARQQYLHALNAATAAGAVAVFGCFAPDGPQHCSGLPVARYGPRELAVPLGRQWTLIARDREDHVTPAGTHRVNPAVVRRYAVTEDRAAVVARIAEPRAAIRPDLLPFDAGDYSAM